MLKDSKDLLKYKKDLKIDDVNLLKIGRHFRFDGNKIVVGRNEKENQSLLMISNRKKLPYLEVVDHMGPITLLEESCSDEVAKKAAEITIRYSDVENCVEVDVKLALSGNVAIIRSTAASDEEINRLRL